MEVHSVSFDDIDNNDERIKVQYTEDGTEFREVSDKNSSSLFPMTSEVDDIFVFYSKIEDEDVRPREFRLVRTNENFAEVFKKALEKMKAANIPSSQNQAPNLESGPSSSSKSRSGYVDSLEDGKGGSSTQQAKLVWDGSDFWLHLETSVVKVLPLKRNGPVYMVQIPGGNCYNIRFNEEMERAFQDTFDDDVEDQIVRGAKSRNPILAKRDLSTTMSDSEYEEENDQHRSQPRQATVSAQSSSKSKKKMLVANGQDNRIEEENSDDESPEDSRKITDDENENKSHKSDLGVKDQGSSSSESESDDELENKARKRRSSKRIRRTPVRSFSVEERKQMIERLRKNLGSPYFARLAKQIRNVIADNKSLASIEEWTEQLLRSPEFQREFMFTFTFSMAGYFNARKRAQTLIHTVVKDQLLPKMKAINVDSILQFGHFEARELWRDQAFEKKIRHALDLSGSHFG